VNAIYKPSFDEHAEPAPAQPKLLAAAMFRAFSQIEGAVKGSTNPHFKNRYADLSAVIDAIKPALVANELWFAQKTHDHDRGILIETVLYHSSGESLSMGRLFVPATKGDPQGYGSALSYARRYSLATAFGLRTFDDDAEAARTAQERKQPDLAVVDSGLLTKLREAATNGMDSLTKAHGELSKLAGFKDVWKQHGEALKAVAAQVPA
jgi:hypothetical protein